MRHARNLPAATLAVCRAAALLPLSATLGCMRAPSFNVLGSYFPGWIACIAAAILLTVALRSILNRTGVEDRLPLLPIFYFSCTLLIACVIWLLAFE